MTRLLSLVGQRWMESARSGVAGIVRFRTERGVDHRRSEFSRIRLREIVIGLALALTSLGLTASSAEAGPRVDLVVAGEATSLEQQAALLTAGHLQRLYEAETVITKASADTSLPAEATHVILFGDQTNRFLSGLDGIADFWPDASKTPSDQGHLIRSVSFRGRPALAIAGRSPRATYWAASEFGYRLGVRSLLDRDLDPITPPEFKLDGLNLNIVMEPALKVRSWTLSMHSPCEAAGWGEDELRRVISQLARLKFNHLRIAVTHSRGFDLLNGDRLPVSGDTLGRKAFGGAKFFEQPYLRDATTPEARRQAMIRLGSQLVELGREYGMQVTFEMTLPPSAAATPEQQQRIFAAIRQIYPQADFMELRTTPAPAPVLEPKPVQEQQPGLKLSLLPLHRSSLLPTLVLNDSRQRLDAIIAVGHDGFAITDTTLGDAELSAFWLSRAGFDRSITATQACRDLLLPVCGDEVPERVQKAFDLIEQATTLLADDPAFKNTLVPERVGQLMSLKEAPPEAWSKARECYLNAMNEMYRANTRAREGSRVYTLYWARRCEFAMEYLNCVEAIRKAGLAQQKKDKATAVTELEKAIESLNGGLNALAAVSRSSSDRGLIAVLNEDTYRPLKKRLEEADAAE